MRDNCKYWIKVQKLICVSATVRWLCLTETYVGRFGSLNIELHGMRFEIIEVNVMTRKINSGDDSLLPICPSMKTHGEFCEVLGNSAVLTMHYGIYFETWAELLLGSALQVTTISWVWNFQSNFTQNFKDQVFNGRYQHQCFSKTYQKTWQTHN